MQTPRAQGALQALVKPFLLSNLKQCTDEAAASREASQGAVVKLLDLKVASAKLCEGVEVNP